MTHDPLSSTSVHALPGSHLRVNDRVVLIIEDDPVFSDMLAAHFRQAGYRPVQEYRGRDAHAVAAVVRPSLIVLDIILPDLDGWSILSELKQLPFMHSVPVLIISIVDDAELKGAIGPTGFLLKPSRRAELTDAVIQLVHTSRTPLRILVVDDEPLVGELSKSILMPPRFEVHVTRNARDAAEWLSDPLHVPDLVLLDLVMPRITGFEFLATLRADVQTRHLPVLVWTAKYVTIQEQHELSQAAQVVIPKKQFSPARLSETLDYIERIRSVTMHQDASDSKEHQSTSDIDMSEFRDDFLREAHEYLERINSWLNNREHGEDGDTLEQIVRAAHTLKSAAVIMEMLDLNQAAFETEMILSCVEKQEVQLDPHTLDTLRALYDEMQQMIAIA